MHPIAYPMLFQAPCYRKSRKSRCYGLRMASEFGDRLRSAGELAGLTQQQLCALVGIGQSTLATAESKGDGSRHTAQLARACGVSAYWLATGEGRMLDRQDARELAEQFDLLPMETEQQLYLRQRVYVRCLGLIADAAGLPPPPIEGEPLAGGPPTAERLRRSKTRT